MRSVNSLDHFTRWSLLLALLVLASSPVLAGGVYLYEKSATDVALGSAGWTARADDPSTIFSNPAGLTRLEGSRLDVSLIPIFLDVQFSPDDQATTTSGTDGDASGVVPAGGVFYSKQLSETVTFGFAFGGYFGLAQEYGEDWVGRYYIKDIQMQALTMEPAVGWKLNDQWSLGIGLAVHYGIFNQTMAVSNEPIFVPGVPQREDGELKLDTTDWAVQGNLGLMWEGDGETRFGFQFLTPSKLSFSDVPEFTGLRPGLEAALDAAGILGTPIDLGMEMPMALRAGFHTEIAEGWRLMGDIGWEQWSQFGKIDVVVGSDDPSSITADRQYKDVWHVGLGAQHDLSANWTLSFGAAYDSTVVDDENRTPDLALGPSVRLGIGAAKRISASTAISFAYEVALAGDLPMAVNRGPLAGNVEGTYKGAAIHFLAATLSKSF